jgi:hypothetical protein
LLEGPVYVESTIERAWSETGLQGYHLLKNDAEHPIYYLRPLIAIETLAWVAEKLNDPNHLLWKTVEDFRTRWQTDQQNITITEAIVKEIFDVDIPTWLLLQEGLKTVVRVVLEGYEGVHSWIRPAEKQKPALYDFVSESASLGELIDYSRWLGDETQTPRTLKSVGASVREIANSEFDFDNLCALVKNRKPADMPLVKALLEHSLSFQRRDQPRQRLVSNDATGCEGFPTLKENPVGNWKWVIRTRCTDQNGNRLYRQVFKF